MRVKVRNLDPCQQYYIAMDVMPVDSKRYRCALRLIIIILIMMIKNLKCHSLPAALLTHTRTRPWPCRYVYHSSQWMVAGNTDHSCISPRLYVHPDSPCAGEMWMRQVISFDRVKLTNNEMDDKGHVGNAWDRILSHPPQDKSRQQKKKLNPVEELRTLNVLAARLVVISNRVCLKWAAYMYTHRREVEIPVPAMVR